MNTLYSTVPEGINPGHWQVFSKLIGEMIADSAMPKEVHEKADERFTQSADGRTSRAGFSDKYTVSKVAFHFERLSAIVPDMTGEETAFVLEQLKLAREQAIDYKKT